MKNQGNFQDQVMKSVLEVVKSHQHDHPMYRETAAERCIIDEKSCRAAFVLFEQIDTDRGSPDASGWLGDQYRYSLWHMKEGEQPKQLYEDHAWIRNSVSTLTGTKGRDCQIYLDELVDDGVIAEITPSDASVGTYDKVKVKITLDGKVEEPEDFLEAARNLVKRVGEKLGCDYLKGATRLEGRDVAAMVWSAENGSTYGYDAVYVVWKDKSGKLQHRELVDSRRTKDYLSVDSIAEEAGDKTKVSVKVNGYSYTLKIDTK